MQIETGLFRLTNASCQMITEQGICHFLLKTIAVVSTFSNQHLFFFQLCSPWAHFKNEISDNLFQKIFFGRIAKSEELS